MTLRLHQTLLLWASAAALAGCMTTTLSGTEMQTAELLPESVARARLARVFGQGWVERPFVYDDPWFCGRNLVPIQFSDIGRMHEIEEGVWAIRTKNRLGFGWACHEGGVYRIGNLSRSERVEVARALRSLGAEVGR